MKKPDGNLLLRALPNFSGIPEVQITAAKTQDHGDFLPLDFFSYRDENGEISNSKKHQALIQKVEKNVRSKKFRTAGFKIFGSSLLLFSAMSLLWVLPNQDSWMLLTPTSLALLAFPAFYFSGKAKSQSISVSEKELLETLDVTPTDLAILNEIRDSKIAIFGKDVTGEFWKYSPQILKTENWRLFLLLGSEAKTVLFLEGQFPIRGLYLLKSDAQNLLQTFGYDERKKAKTKNRNLTETSGKGPKATPRSTKVSKVSRKKKKYELPKILDKLPLTGRFSPFLKCILWKKKHAIKFLRKAKKEKEASGLSPARKRYFNTAEFIHDNWSSHKDYQKGKLSGEKKISFEAGLLENLKGNKNFKTPDDDMLNDLLNAQIRSFDDWIKKMEIIPAEDLTKVTMDYLNSKK